MLSDGPCPGRQTSHLKFPNEMETLTPRNGPLREANHLDRITSVLEATYQSPSLGNKEDPLDELVFIVLSQMTQDSCYQAAYRELEERLDSWDQLVMLSAGALEDTIRSAGLARRKARFLKGIAKQLQDDFGEMTLRPLAGWSTDRAETYLRSLPGVGLKTARCVLLFSFDRPVLPVDTHVRRVSERLGLVTDDEAQHAEEQLQTIVPPDRRRAFHLNAVAHGRRLCTARSPGCAKCPLSAACPRLGVRE